MLVINQFIVRKLICADNEVGSLLTSNHLM